MKRYQKGFIDIPKGAFELLFILAIIGPSYGISTGTSNESAKNILKYLTISVGGITTLFKIVFYWYANK